jgi:hypothetical protein
MTATAICAMLHEMGQGCTPGALGPERKDLEDAAVPAAGYAALALGAVSLGVAALVGMRISYRCWVWGPDGPAWSDGAWAERGLALSARWAAPGGLSRRKTTARLPSR